MEEERVWLPAMSGHGSAYRFDMNDKDSFKERVLARRDLMTYQEAQDEVSRWQSMADTIGGDGIVVNVVEFIQQPGWCEHFPFMSRSLTVGEWIAQRR